MTTEHYDVIIIGTGAGGSTLAHKLAPSGKRILLLERGGYLAREPETGTAARSYQRPLPVRRGLVRQGASRCVPGRAGRRRGSAASGTGRPGRPEGGFVRRGQVDRRYGGGFGDHFGHAQRPEPSLGRPGTGGRFGAKGRGGGAVAFGGQQVAGRALPARAEDGGAPWAVTVP